MIQKIKGITKEEIQILSKHYNDYKLAITKLTELTHIIAIVHNPSRLHDSGYPYIRVFGANGKNLYEMGWHDHILFGGLSDGSIAVNSDALHKNIFRFMKWERTEKWFIDANPLFCSSLILRGNGKWE